MGGTRKAEPGFGTISITTKSRTAFLATLIAVLSSLVVGCGAGSRGAVRTTVKGLSIRLSVRKVASTPSEDTLLVRWRWRQPQMYASDMPFQVFFEGISKKDWHGQVGAASVRAANGCDGLWCNWRLGGVDSPTHAAADNAPVSITPSSSGWVLVDFFRMPNTRLAFPTHPILLFGAKMANGNYSYVEQAVSP